MSKKTGNRCSQPFPLLFLFLIFVVGCVVNKPAPSPTVIAHVTGIAVVATPIPTLTSEIQPSSTPEPTETLTPTLTPTPTVMAVLPSTSIIFVRDNALQQWIPSTDEVKILTNDVYARSIYSWVKYLGEIVVFLREVTPEKEYDLVVFHIPTQTESIVRRLHSQQYFTPDTIIYSLPPQSSLSISPDGKWLAYATNEGTEQIATISVHEIRVDDQQVSVSSPIFTYSPTQLWSLDSFDFLWPANNQISWRDGEGIWVTNLDANPIEPVIVIQPSTNMVPLPACDDNMQPCVFRTTYWPVGWSSDGRYLLVIESRYEGGVWYVVEAVTNRLYEFTNSYAGMGGDTFYWFDSTSLLQFNVERQVRIWRVNSSQTPFISLEKTIQLSDDVGHDFRGVIRMPDGHVRFGASALSGPAATAFYDLDLDTEELFKLSPDVAQREVSLFWSPDRQHILSEATWIDDTLFLFDLNGSQPVDVRPVLGLNSCCWYWYEGQ